MLLAFLLTLLAGLSTVIGGLIGVHKSLLKCKSLAVALGFSAGAMIYVSFMDLLPEGQLSLESAFGEYTMWIVGVAFISGLLAISLLDKFIPHEPNICEVEQALEGKNKVTAYRYKKLLRSGIVVAIALALHNFPEGIATFAGAMHDASLGVSIAIAIALHNIPEGVAVAAPIYAATKNRAKAVGYAALSGLAEPLGAVAGYALLSWLLPDGAIGLIFCSVAGMMVYVSINELLPAAKDYETSRHQSAVGFIAGCSVMLISLNLLAASSA
ncbi:MAG: zinc transporter ZupT [Candidatus Woesebacteria bacterium]|jgi:ZIP family zinc transporter